jgi:hypothetical protein
MFTVVLRSVCVGIAALVAAAFLGILIGLPIGLYVLSRTVPPEGGGEVGWDVVSLAHSFPAASILVPLLIFAVGFFFGFRYFSKSLARR